MIKVAGIVCLMAILSSCRKEVNLSEEVRNQVKKEVNQLFSQLVEASNALDAARYFEYIDADKFLGLNANGTNWNSIEDLKSLIYPSFDMVEKVEFLKFTNVQISVIDANTAILVNEYEQSILLKSGEVVKSAGGGTQVWSKASGNWKLVSVSASNKSA
mgnify:FL=1